MALVKCKECGKAISGKADRCPACGAPVKKRMSVFSWTVIALIVAAFVFGFVMDRSKGGSGIDFLKTDDPLKGSPALSGPPAQP